MKLYYFIVFLSSLLFINIDASNFPIARSSTDFTAYQEMADNSRVAAPLQRLQSSIKTRTASDIDLENSIVLDQPVHVSVPNTQLIPSCAQIVAVPVPAHQTPTREKLSVKTRIAFGVLAATSIMKLGLNICYFQDYYSRPHTPKDASNLLVIELTNAIVLNGLWYTVYKLNEDIF